MSDISRQEVIERIDREKVIAIIRGEDAETCLKVSQALYDGGIHLIEVTFNNADPDSFDETAKAIAAINTRFNGAVYAGAGTVTSVELTEKAAGAGAQYIISPDTNPDVIKRTRELGMVSIPGALSPTEIEAAHNAGADYVKLFPAGDLGAAYIKAIRSPINNIKLMAVGGVGENNLKDFLKAGVCGAGIGGSLVSKDYIRAGRFDLISENARRLVAVVKETEG
ncbi:MAG: bifunctional 4-hydroxy-2-oxoglutarate aldolase/2-dehydro-3-deoxy-phosphogluconate aldolase [Clostridiales bacterium]|nr:bifunctional 4-hydroxy-2-oxoglutarate aldolase/2-dehydro-3-deoxy-phosphogluconate aldolase [Clostridiales bacterium]